MSNKLPECLWIRKLREQVEAGNKADASVWTEVHITLPLGWARRLLYILDLARSDDGDGGVNNDLLVQETYLLATGAMEG